MTLTNLRIVLTLGAYVVPTWSAQVTKDIPTWNHFGT